MYHLTPFQKKWIDNTVPENMEQYKTVLTTLKIVLIAAENAEKELSVK